ncbi:peptidylprolyl isomerase [Ascidiaceihabitans sp.]|uniref:peptidylprolyl isomerase n=2 Tax=Ascidiaceihabitans sp. TaxID=1872644 RepID=UPI0032999B59
MSSKPMKRSVLALALTAALALPATAQNLFKPVVQVNDSIVTEFEVNQRIRFLQIIGAPGGTRDAAIEALIEDRLRIEATRDAGLVLTEEGITASMAEFATRGNIELPEFVRLLGQAGVSQETFRDFVTVNIAWRDLIRARYGNRVQISSAEIDRALAASSDQGSIRILLSEIIIPAPPPKAAQVQALAERIAQAKSIAEFSSFARQHSATATRTRGGRLDWVPLSNMPPQLRGVILGLSVGEITQPLPIPGAVALFQLRDIEETDAPAPEFAALEYAAYYMAGGRSQATLSAAEALKTKIDVCDDLYAVAKGQPESALDRGSLAPADIPQDIAIELAKLDPGEVSTNLTRSNGETLVFLMLCGRTAALNEETDRETVAAGLRQQQLTGLSDSLLEQLRADARIEYK